MNDVKFIRQSLEKVAGILEAAGKKTQTKAVQSVIALLDGHDDDPVPTFLEVLQQQLTQKPEKKVTPTKELRTETIEQYVRLLKAAGTDKSAFDSAFARLSKDKAVRKGEADAIAHAYTRGRTKWPKKQDAIDAIKVHFDEQAYDETKMNQVDQANRW
jgi:hypothetical protein